MGVSLPRSGQSVSRWIGIGVVAVVLLWVLFFDSHSVLKRVSWHQEHEALTAENKELRQQIDALEKKLGEPLPDAVVERIAREEYGMKRPGETVYPVETDQ